MVVTEEEAKGKNCPFFDRMCGASNCMAWAWYFEEDHEKEESGLLNLKIKYKKTEKGSCGRI